MENLKWVNSNGGPLVLMDSMWVEHWTGASIKKEKDEAVSDYDRACAVVGFVGKLEVCSHHAIVLGDEPAQSTLVKISNESFLVVRWIWSPDEQQILEYIETHLNSINWIKEGVTVNLDSGRAIMFDSAIPGAHEGSQMELNVEAGEYSVSTSWCRPTPDLNFVLHQFIRSRE